MISVRDYKNKDEENLLDLFSEEKSLIHIIKSTKQDCAYTAVYQEQAVGMIIADNIVMDGSLIYQNDTETNVLAYSFLHHIENNETLELGWCGSEIQHIDLIPCLVWSQIAYPAKHGIQFMTGEFDTTSEYAMKVLHDMLFPPSEAWVTYQKNVTSGSVFRLIR